MLVDEKLKQLLGTLLKLDPAEIGPESSQDNIDTWDSLKHINLILAIEEEFCVSLPDDEIDRLTSYALIRLALEECLVPLN